MTSFQIIEDYNIGDKRVFTLIAEDPEDRDVWWTDLTQLLKKLEGERKGPVFLFCSFKTWVNNQILNFGV